MPNYKDADNKLYFLDDAQYEYLLPAGCVEIAEAEAEAIRLAQAPIVEPAPESTKAELQAQLVALTAKIEAL